MIMQIIPGDHFSIQAGKVQVRHPVAGKIRQYLLEHQLDGHLLLAMQNEDMSIRARIHSDVIGGLHKAAGYSIWRVMTR